jgi:hypothetical protein
MEIPSKSLYNKDLDGPAGFKTLRGFETGSITRVWAGVRVSKFGKKRKPERKATKKYFFLDKILKPVIINKKTFAI